MPYVKLDVGILDSTLWINRDDRDTFITALLMAEPREITDAMPQLEVDSLEPTGFVIPPGWYGWIAAAGPGILRRAMVDHKEGIEALRRLGSPDPESRSQAFEGRRLIRVNGGYVALNYMSYREKDHTAKDRQARWREKNRNGVTALRNGVTPSQNVSVTRNITEAEAEAYIKVKSTVGHKPDAAAQVLEFLNTKTRRQFRPVRANLDLIRARLKEGFTADELRQVVAKKVREWQADDKMAQFLRPATLFAARNFAQYSGELVKEGA